MKYWIIAIMVIGCSAGADTHHGKLTYAEADRIIAKQISTYAGQYDEDLDKEAEKAQQKKQK